MPLETTTSSGSNSQNAAVYDRLLGPPPNANTEIDVEDGERGDRPRPNHRPIRYMELGMDVHDALTVVNILSKYKNILVEEKMIMQRGILVPDDAEKPWKNGLVTFAAFLVFGCAPLLSFIVLIPFTRRDTVKFVGACILSALALALLGLAKAKIAGENYMLCAHHSVRWCCCSCRCLYCRLDP